MDDCGEMNGGVNFESVIFGLKRDLKTTLRKNARA